MKILLVFLGGGLGSVCRYAVSIAMARSGSPLPWATLLVNVLGCLLIGLLAQTLAAIASCARCLSPDFAAALLRSQLFRWSA